MRKRNNGLKAERDITVAEAMEMEAAAWEAVVEAYKATAKAYEADGNSESAASARRRAADADKGVSEAWERSLDALGGAWNLSVAEKTGVDALEGAALARKMIPPLQEDAENSEDARKPFEDAVVAWQKAAQAWDAIAETYGGERWFGLSTQVVGLLRYRIATLFQSNQATGGIPCPNAPAEPTPLRSRRR